MATWGANMKGTCRGDEKLRALALEGLNRTNYISFSDRTRGVRHVLPRTQGTVIDLALRGTRNACDVRNLHLFFFCKQQENYPRKASEAALIRGAIPRLRPRAMLPRTSGREDG